MRSLMQSYIAFLRGVNNVGAAKRVAMADLRDLFESLGFSDVATLLNSGNVVFSSMDLDCAVLRTRIEKALAVELGLKTTAVVFSAKELRKAVSENPLSKIAVNRSHLLVLIPRNRSDLVKLRSLLEQKWKPEALAKGRYVAYLWCANGVARSPLWAAADKALERSGTVRNINTLSKAVALMERGRM